MAQIRERGRAPKPEQEVAKVPSVRNRNRRRKQGQALPSPSLESLSLLVCHNAGIRGDQHWEVPAVSSPRFTEKLPRVSLDSALHVWRLGALLWEQSREPSTFPMEAKTRPPQRSSFLLKLLPLSSQLLSCSHGARVGSSQPVPSEQSFRPSNRRAHFCWQ